MSWRTGGPELHQLTGRYPPFRPSPGGSRWRPRSKVATGSTLLPAMVPPSAAIAERRPMKERDCNASVFAQNRLSSRKKRYWLVSVSLR